MHGTDFFRQGRDHDASKYTMSPPKLILAVCASAVVQGCTMYCSLGLFLANKLVRVGMIAKGAKKAILELSISGTYTIL